MNVSIEFDDTNKSLAALIRIDRELMEQVLKKTIDELMPDFHEGSLTINKFSLVNRLDCLLRDATEASGGFSVQVLLDIAKKYTKLDISKLIADFDKLRAEINNIPANITKDEVISTTKDCIDSWCESRRFPVDKKTRTYLKDRLLDDDTFSTERKATSNLYWLHQEIHEGDEVRKITKAGKTIGKSSMQNGQRVVVTDKGVVPQTNAWNKERADVDFDGIGLQISRVYCRMKRLLSLLNEGPIKGEIVMLEVERFNEAPVCMPVLLTKNAFMPHPFIPQLVITDFNNRKLRSKQLSYFLLNEDYRLSSSVLEVQLIDSMIVNKIKVAK